MFDIAFNRRKNTVLYIRKFFLHPPRWTDATMRLPFTPQWKSEKFTEANRHLIPNTPGVYCFVVKPSYPDLFETIYLFYVGKTDRALRTRFSEYLREKVADAEKARYKVQEMLNLYEDDLYFYYAEVPFGISVQS